MWLGRPERASAPHDVDAAWRARAATGLTDAKSAVGRQLWRRRKARSPALLLGGHPNLTWVLTSPPPGGLWWPRDIYYRGFGDLEMFAQPYPDELQYMRSGEVVFRRRVSHSSLARHSMRALDGSATVFM